MKEKITKLDVDKVLALYLSTLRQMGEHIPKWLKDVNFVEFKELTGACATASAESNTIYYRPDASAHAIFHELEHLRSRHKESVVGFDDLFERNVDFFFIGYHLGGFEGMFIEEGLNELSARKLYLKAIAGNETEKRKAFDEYKENKYYHLEMFTCISLAYLIGVNVDDLRRMKFSGDMTGSNFLREKVNALAGDSTYWRRMQEYLDGFEIAKRVYVDEKSKNEYKRESLTGYYGMAYNLLFTALERNKITIDEFRKRMQLFENYYAKSAKYVDGLFESVKKTKGLQLLRFKDVLVKNRVYSFAQSNKTKTYRTGVSSVRVNLPQVIPVASKSVAAKLFSKLVRIKEDENVEYASTFDDIKYGLM